LRKGKNLKLTYTLVAALTLAASFATAFANEAGDEQLIVAMHQDATLALETKIGDRLPDGTGYAGTSPETGKALYTTPGDAPNAYNWDSGSRYVPTFRPAAITIGGYRPRANCTCCSRTGPASVDFSKPVRIPPVGTGRPRRASSTVRGLSTSATGTSTTTSRSTTRLCGVCGRVFEDFPRCYAPYSFAL
jgi:Ni/Co efflux regulator RcnB